MVRRLILFTFALLCLGGLGASAARAIDLPVQGGSGGAPFRIRCEPGSFITGLEGHTGAHIDHFRILCGSFDPVPRRITPRGALPITIGASTGGGPSSTPCPDGWALFGMVFDGTNDNFVRHIEIHCAPPKGPENIWLTYGTMDPKPYTKQLFNYGYKGFNNIRQNCPPGEFAVGMHGRYGLYVDAMGLICEPLPAAPPPPAPQAISPNYQPNAAGLGTPSPGKQAIINTLPPAPAPTPIPAPQVATAPPPSPPAVRHTSFTGTWDTRTDKNWTYVITFDQDGRNVSGRYTAQDGSKGKISGRVKDNVLEFKWEQDGGFKGSGQFALAADGNSFSGVYTTEPNKKITDPRYLQGSWTGTRR